MGEYKYSNKSYTSFHTILYVLLNKHAPLKSKSIRDNEVPFMGKTLRKAIIMRRLNIKYTFIKYPTTENRDAYKRQRNLCVNLNRKAKKNFFNGSFTNSTKSLKKRWKTVRPFFTNKTKESSKIIVIDNDKIESKDEDLVKTFNNQFGELYQNITQHCIKTMDPVN